jgi:CRP-like cAMP-binding protein
MSSDLHKRRSTDGMQIKTAIDGSASEEPPFPDRYHCKRQRGSAPSLFSDDFMQATFFKGTSQKFLASLDEFLQLETFKEGAFLMKEGEKGDKLVFLFLGRVDVFVGSQKVTSCGPGSVLGEMALLGSPLRTATVIATEFCSARVLDRRSFHGLLRKFPDEREFFEKMGQERMQEVKKQRQQLRETTFRGAPKEKEKEKEQRTALPKVWQNAVDKMVTECKQKRAGRFSEAGRGSITVPSIRRDRSSLRSTPPALGDSAQNRYRAAASKAANSFLALYKRTKTTSPRIHRDSTHHDFNSSDEVTDETAAKEEREQQYSLPGEVTEDPLYASCLAAFSGRHLFGASQRAEAALGGGAKSEIVLTSTRPQPPGHFAGQEPLLAATSCRRSLRGSGQGLVDRRSLLCSVVACQL